MADEREPYSWDIVEIGAPVGHIAQLNNQKRKTPKKHPIGFAASPGLPRKPRGLRRPGTFPDVPRFDVLEDT